MKRLFCAVCGAMVAASGVAGSKAGGFPDMEGVVVHLDASDSTTILTNELGQVTNWVSKTDNGLYFYNDDSVNAADPGGRMAPPMWTADGSKLGGPAVRFGYNPYEGTKKWNVLAPSIPNKLPHRTVALVCKTPENRMIPCNLSHVWGRNKDSTGLGTQSNDVGDGSFGTSSAWISGGRAWVDGALAYAGSNVGLQPIGVGKGLRARQNVHAGRNADKVDVAGRHMPGQVLVHDLDRMSRILDDSRNRQQAEVGCHPRLERRVHRPSSGFRLYQLDFHPLVQ